MSITGFQDAIKDQVSHYDDTISTLRNNEILQRNTALAGIQSEVEKYGEIAKLGLEFPLAIEGLKAVSKTARAGFTALKGAKGAATDALSNITSQLEGGTEGLAARARSAVPSFQNVSDRFDALRAQGEGLSDQASNSIRNVVTQPRLQGADGDSLTGEGTEMSPVDDFSNSNSLLRPDTYGQDVTSTSVPLDARGGVSTSVNTPDPVTAPVDDVNSQPVQRFLGRDGVATPNAKPPAPEVDDDPDEPAPRSRPGDVEMGDQDSISRPSMVRQNSSGYNEVDREQNPDYKPPRPTSKAPGAGEYDDNLPSNTAGIEPTEAPPPVPGSEPPISSIASDAIEDGVGEETGGIFEGLGAGLLASGIFAPLGALMEGIGAVTEVASVGAGVYGAVQSMIDTGKEDALRKAPLAQIQPGNLDVGGSVAAPELA